MKTRHIASGDHQAAGSLAAWVTLRDARAADELAISYQISHRERQTKDPKLE